MDGKLLAEGTKCSSKSTHFVGFGICFAVTLQRTLKVA